MFGIVQAASLLDIDSLKTFEDKMDYFSDGLSPLISVIDDLMDIKWNDSDFIKISNDFASGSFILFSMLGNEPIASLTTDKAKTFADSSDLFTSGINDLLKTVSMMMLAVNANVSGKSIAEITQDFAIGSGILFELAKTSSAYDFKAFKDNMSFAKNSYKFILDTIADIAKTNKSYKPKDNLEIFSNITASLFKLIDITAEYPTAMISEFQDKTNYINESVKTILSLQAEMVKAKLQQNKFVDLCNTLRLGSFELMSAVAESSIVNDVDAKEFKKKTQEIVSAMDLMYKTLLKVPKTYTEGTKALKELDKQLIEQDDKRLKALNNTQKGFDGINKSIQELTKSYKELIKTEMELISLQTKPSFVERFERQNNDIRTEQAVVETRTA